MAQCLVAGADERRPAREEAAGPSSEAPSGSGSAARAADEAEAGTDDAVGGSSGDAQPARAGAPSAEGGPSGETLGAAVAGEEVAAEAAPEVAAAAPAPACDEAGGPSGGAGASTRRSAADGHAGGCVANGDAFWRDEHEPPRAQHEAEVEGWTFEDGREEEIEAVGEPAPPPPPTALPPEAAEEASRWPAHRAAFDDEAELLTRLTEGWAREQWEAHDPCGNSIAHLAALRGSRRCLRVALGGGRAAWCADAKNLAGWTPFQEAVAARDMPTARLVFDLTQAQSGGAAGRAAAAELKLSSLAALGRVPDFQLRIRWRFGANALIGWMVKKYAPSDTYTVYKRGDRLRVDGTLLGMEVNEKSLLPRWRRGGFSLLVPAPPEGEEPTLYVINHETRCFASTRTKRAPPPPPPARARLGLTVGSGGAVRCAVHVETPPPKTEDDLKFEELFFRGVMGKDELLPDAAQFRPLKDWRGAQQTERIDGVPTRLYEASTRLRSTQTVKTNHYVLGESFAHYLCARDRVSNHIRTELLTLPVSYDDVMKAAGMRKNDKPEEEGSRLKARVWLAPQFPLNVQHMLLMLEVIATANKTARRLMAALEVWSASEAFPMKLHMPLLMSVFAQLSCSHYAPCTAADAPDSLFELPSGYEAKELEHILAESVSFEGDEPGSPLNFGSEDFMF